MREILFRGKQENNGEWVYGLPTIDDFVTTNGIERAYCIKEIPSDIGSGFKWVRVIPETLGQYTAMTDKNATKIFEGDIISIPLEEDRSPWEENCIHYENAEVYFDTERYGWYVRFSDNDEISLWEYDEIDVVVIGNIHDNPEILK